MSSRGTTGNFLANTGNYGQGQESVSSAGNGRNNLVPIETESESRNGSNALAPTWEPLIPLLGSPRDPSIDNNAPAGPAYMLPVLPLSNLLPHYPIVWQGNLTLPLPCFVYRAMVQMHFVVGRLKVAQAALPGYLNEETSEIKITRKIRPRHGNVLMVDENSCLLVAFPQDNSGNDEKILENEAELARIISHLQGEKRIGLAYYPANYPIPSGQFQFQIYGPQDLANFEQSNPGFVDVVNAHSHVLVLITHDP